MGKDIPKQQSPTNPMIVDNTNCNLNSRDTLDRLVAGLKYLTEQSVTEELSSEARYGRYLIQLMLIDSLNYVSDALDGSTIDD